MLEVIKDELIEAVKSMIHVKELFTPQQQRLVFRGAKLEEGRTLADYNILKEFTLELFVRVNIFVIMPTKNTISLDVELNDKVDSVKSQIQSETGIRATCQRIFIADTKLDNASTLAECGVTDGGTLRLEESQYDDIDIQITLPSKVITVCVNPQDTVSELKRKIEGRSGIPLGEMLILINGKSTDEGAKEGKTTLHAFDIQSNSKVSVTNRLHGGF